MNIEYNQLIDRVVSYDETGSIHCESFVPDSALIFENHFPGNPIIPGAILIEMMAQAGGYMYMRRTQFEKMAYLAAVRSAKFKRFASPGIKLSLKSSLNHIGDGYIVSDSKIYDSDESQVIASSQLMLKLHDFQSPDMKEQFRQIYSAASQGKIKYRGAESSNDIITDT